MSHCGISCNCSAAHHRFAVRHFRLRRKNFIHQFFHGLQQPLHNKLPKFIRMSFICHLNTAHHIRSHLPLWVNKGTDTFFPITIRHKCHCRGSDINCDGYRILLPQSLLPRQYFLLRHDCMELYRIFQLHLIGPRKTKLAGFYPANSIYLYRTSPAGSATITRSVQYDIVLLQCLI